MKMVVYKKTIIIQNNLLKQDKKKMKPKKIE